MTDPTPSAAPEEPTSEPRAEGPANSLPSAEQAKAQVEAKVGEAKAVLSAMHRLDLGIVIAGAVALVASVLPFFTMEVNVLGVGQTESFSAWHDVIGGGFFGWIGVMAAVGGALAMVLPLMGATLPVSRRLAALGCFGVSVAALLIAFFVTPIDCKTGIFDACDVVDPGHGFGYYLALLAAVVGAALAAMRRGEQ